jgi:hypothetical protein
VQREALGDLGSNAVDGEAQPEAVSGSLTVAISPKRFASPKR